MDPQISYVVKAYEPEHSAGTLVFSFVPKEVQTASRSGEPPARSPEYVVKVGLTSEGSKFDWTASPDNPGDAKIHIEARIASLVRERTVWIQRIHQLVADVEGWARELDWATRRIEKRLNDASVGDHRVPALIMQADTCRVMLEPVAHAASGVEGIVDLYLMPGYDDLASIYFVDGNWKLHLKRPAPVGGKLGDADEVVPLTKDAFARALGEMKKNAA